MTSIIRRWILPGLLLPAIAKMSRIPGPSRLRTACDFDMELFAARRFTFLGVYEDSKNWRALDFLFELPNPELCRDSSSFSAKQLCQWRMLCAAQTSNSR